MFWCIKINIELYDKSCATAITTQYNTTDKQAQNPTEYIFTTAAAHSDDLVYLAITFNIDLYTAIQSKIATTSINKPNGEILNVISAVVIDIHQRTQTEKRLFFIKYSNETGIEKIAKQRFFSLCSLMCINNYSTFDIKNFMVSFIDTWYWCYRLF